MAILMVVIGMIFLMGLFSYFYLFGRSTELWIDPPSLTSTILTIAAQLAAVGLAAWSRRALARGEGRRRAAIWLLILAATLLSIAFLADLAGWRSIGLSPVASSQGAIVHALLGLQGCLLFIAVLMAAFVAGRGARALIATPRSNVIDLPAIYFVFVGIMGTASAAMTRLLPALL
jgi:cytochrome c oxidase subunit I+III